MFSFQLGVLVYSIELSHQLLERPLTVSTERICVPRHYYQSPNPIQCHGRHRSSRHALAVHWVRQVAMNENLQIIRCFLTLFNNI